MCIFKHTLLFLETIQNGYILFFFHTVFIVHTDQFEKQLLRLSVFTFYYQKLFLRKKKMSRQLSVNRRLSDVNTRARPSAVVHPLEVRVQGSRAAVSEVRRRIERVIVEAGYDATVTEPALSAIPEDGYTPITNSTGFLGNQCFQDILNVIKRLETA